MSKKCENCGHKIFKNKGGWAHFSSSFSGTDIVCAVVEKGQSCFCPTPEPKGED